VEVIATPITFGGKAAVQFIARDIAGRKQAEEALRRSESQFRLIWENSVDGMRLTDGAGTVLMVNDAFCRLVGKPRPKIEGKPMCDIYAEANREPILARHHERFVSRTVPAHLEQQYKLWDGREIWLEVANCFFEPEPAKLILLGVFRDITGRKLAERQMQRTQRLESIGTLASGVAHDLNNALAPILMAGQMLRLEFPDTASRYLELIQTSARRGADMVKQLVSFAKGAEGERLLVQPKHLLQEMQKLIKGTFPKNIQLQTSCAKDLRTILGDATQLHQVLLNLCVNARDAMPEGGTLTLEAENKEIDATYASAVPEAKPGRYVVWRVKDTGTGIPPEILDRIFDPFFSTKGPDKGTGLGLSTVIGIVKGHGGFIRVYSTPGQGSSFAVYLPAYGAGSGDTSLLTKPDTTFRGHGETILVVDDEVSVREVVRGVLTALNFKVLTAANGTAALIQVSEYRADLRAVITDLHMPHMDGLSFVRVLKGRLPQAGVIVMSGRVDEPAAGEFKKLGVHAVIEKPFMQEKLVEALKTVFPK
jgi:PAS domain S-box-containing protein